MKPCHNNNGSAINIGRCIILCFNAYTTLEYLNRNFSNGQLIHHISKSIVVCTRSRPKMLTKTYNKEIYQASQPLRFINYVVM